MIYIISVTIFVIFIVSYIRKKIDNNRQIHFNEMNTICDKMEVYVYSNRLQNKKEVLVYIIPFKYFVVNTGFADIEILLGSLIKLYTTKTFESRKQQYNQIISTIPDELKDLGKEFDKHLDKAIKLSFFRAEFLLFFIKQFTLAIIKAIINRSFTTVIYFFGSFKEVFKYENILVLSNNTNKDLQYC